MFATRGLNIFELDRRATTAEAPYAIYTSDCSDPREIDDGVFVEPLPSAIEAYRVGVCVADTSKLYLDGGIRKTVLERVHADYWDLPNGERGYDPLIDPMIIKDLELAEGNIRNALIVSFVIARNVLPSEVEVNFGKIEVIKNHSYKDFSMLTVPGSKLQKYSRASQLILAALNFKLGGDSTHHPPESGPRNLKNVSYQSWKRGARMNEAFMVAANHLVGKMLRDEEYPAIYRVHDLNDVTFEEIMETNTARYTQTPGPHYGLGVDPYCRVTSPLRRLEDFVMNYLLRLRSQGKEPTPQDLAIMSQAIRSLNKRAIYESESNSLTKIRNQRERARLQLVRPIKSAAAS